MEIRRVRFSDPAVESLLVGLSDEYDARYGENIEMTRASEAEFDPPAGLFIVLMDGPTTAAGGGFRRFNESSCEVKRMWTSPLYRGADWPPGCCKASKTLLGKSVMPA
jgi:hypothetical protein